MMLSVFALALFLATNSSAICVASSVSWRPALFGRLSVGRSNTNTATAPSPAEEVMVDVRGGDAQSPAEQTLRRYIAESSTNSGRFHVQGWRWHTMSVMREAERLQKLAQQMEQQDTADVSRLAKAADYVVDFNLKALHRVEAMFFPKTRQWMKDSTTAQPEIVQAFDEVVANLEEDKKRMAELGKKITHSISTSPKSNVARTVASQTGELIDLAKSMLDRELEFLMPTLSICVPEKEQQKFNNQVIKFLGVLEARVHLVHMYEVVEASNSKLEQKLWEESIPKLPRSMIPRWKRSLYEPKAAALVLP